MDGKKATTPQPGDFSNDRFDRILAEGRAALRRSEDARASLRLPPAELTEEQNRDGEFLTQSDKDLEERRIQSREFRAKVHKVSMIALSLDEIQLTEALAAKAKTGKPPQESKDAKPATEPPKEESKKRGPKGFEGLDESQRAHNYSDMLASARLTDKQHTCASLVFEYGLRVKEVAARVRRHRRTVHGHLEVARKKISMARLKEGGAKQKAKTKPGSLEPSSLEPDSLG